MQNGCERGALAGPRTRGRAVGVGKAGEFTGKTNPSLHVETIHSKGESAVPTNRKIDTLGN